MVTMIVDFLRARFDEIEATARAATPGPWGTNHQFDEGFVTDSEGSYLIYSEGTVDIPTAEHIALHDPAYVLADIVSKRRIMALHAIGVDPCDAHDANFESVPCETMLLLALPFEWHPDYNESWRT